MVFSFVSRRIQPLQHRQHPAFRYEGTKDPTRLSPEAMAHSEVVRRCCRILDNFDKSLKLPALFWAGNPPEKTWVSVVKYYRVLVGMHFDLLTNSCLLCRKIIRHGNACLQPQKMLLLLMIAGNGRQLLELCYRGKFTVPTVASKNLTFLIRSCLPQLSYFKFCLARIKYLPAHEKDQIQDFRN